MLLCLVMVIVDHVELIICNHQKLCNRFYIIELYVFLANCEIVFGTMLCPKSLHADSINAFASVQQCPIEREPSTATTRCYAIPLLGIDHFLFIV